MRNVHRITKAPFRPRPKKSHKLRLMIKSYTAGGINFESTGKITVIIRDIA